MHGISVVELGGKKWTLAFNMHCLMFLSKVLNCNPDEVDVKINAACDINPLRGVSIVCYCGILGHLETECIYDHDVTLKDVSKWVGEAGDNILSVWNAFGEVMGYPKATQEQIDAYAKKQAVAPSKKKSKMSL